MKKEKKTKAAAGQKTPKPPAPTLLERANNYACPMLLGGLLCFTVVYALYRPYAPLYSVLFLIAELGLFMLFDKLKTRRVTGGLIYIALMLGSLFLAVNLTFSKVSSAEFLNPFSWFYGEEGSYSYHPEYLNAVFVGGGFFLISILYYFTQIRYRSLGVMLCILFPFVIYAKRAEEMPEIIVTLIITMYLAVMVHNRRLDPAQPQDKRGQLVVNRSYLISIAIFVSVTGAITMMIDKPTYRSKLEQDSNYFSYVQTNVSGSGDQEDLQPQSSDRSGNPVYTNNPVFYFDTDGELPEYFLRVQSFSYFNNHLWQFNGDYSMFSNAYSTILPEYSTDDIVADMRSLTEQGVFPEDAAPDSFLPNKRSGRVYDEDFSPNYLPAPYSTITDTAEYADLKHIKYPQSVILRVRPNSTVKAPVLNDSFEFFEQDAALYSYAASLGLSGEEYIGMLTEAQWSGLDTGGLLDDYYSALQSYTSMAGVSDRVAQLAYEIVGDADSDMKKARRLEAYFEEAGYEYSLEYVPPDDSIEYFIFESKTGYCTNYATAMTLMARSVGLPARYVEGFAAFEKTDENTFVVRDSCAHAFVEVYIPGAGWLTFDPTVSGYMVIPEEETGFNTAAFMRILSRLLVVIIVAFVVIFVLLLDRILELILRVRLRFKTPSQRTLILYANLIKLVNFSAGGDYSAYTVKMLRRYLTETRGVVPEKLLMLFERTCFGGYQPSEEDFAKAYDEYKQCYRYLRKIPKQKALLKLKNA